MKRILLYVLACFAAVCCGKEEETGGTTEATLTVPADVKLHSATDNTLSFQWTAVEGASSYDWKLTLEGAEAGSGTVSTRNVKVEKLTAGTTYGFSIRSVGTSGSSAYSAEISATTTGTAPKPVDPSAKKLLVDAPLVLELDSAPTLGTSGLIRIYTSAGEEVDRIDLADLATVTVLESGIMVPKEKMTNETKRTTFMDAMNGGNRYRIVSYTPLRINGKTLEIRAHCGALDFGKEYYVTLDAGVISGHAGVAAGEWAFATAAAPASDTKIRVAADGSGDFYTIQRALAYASKSGAEISIAEGTYEEPLYLRDKSSITLKGDSREKTRIVYPNSELYANGSGGGVSKIPSFKSAVGACGGRSLFLVENCDNFVLENLTIENSFYAADHQGQAECIYFNSGSNAHKMTIGNCTLLSWQDTFLTKGQVWVHDSLIAGHVDFIWGYPSVCLFENCEIRARAGGYIIQARVPSVTAKGFIFLNCSLTAEEGVKDGVMYLARSGGSTEYYDNVVFVNCKMSSVINAAGWYTKPAPNPSAPTATSGWREYGSVTSSGAAVTGHNTSGKVLTAAEAEPYLTREKILGW